MVPHWIAPVLPRESRRDPVGTSQWNCAGFGGPGYGTRHSATGRLMPWIIPPAWKPWPLLAIMRPNYIRQSWNFYTSREVHQQQPFPSRHFWKQRHRRLFIFQIANHLFQGLIEEQEEWKCNAFLQCSWNQNAFINEHLALPSTSHHLCTESAQASSACKVESCSVR